MFIRITLPANDNRWYVIGYDVDRDAIRTFALARMNESTGARDISQRNSA